MSRHVSPAHIQRQPDRSPTRRPWWVIATALSAGLLPSACALDQGQTRDTPQKAVAGANATTSDGSIKLLNLTIAQSPGGSSGQTPAAAGTVTDAAAIHARIFNDGARPAKLTRVTVEGSSAGTASVVLFDSSQPSPSSPEPRTSDPGDRRVSPDAVSPTATPPGSPNRAAGPASPSTSTSPRRGSAAPARTSGSPSPSPMVTVRPSPSPTLVVTSDFAVTIPPGQLVVLAPVSGRFLALRGLSRNLAAGSCVHLTFSFAYSQDGTEAAHVPVPVGPQQRPTPA